MKLYYKDNSSETVVRDASNLHGKVGGEKFYNKSSLHCTKVIAY